VAIGCDLENTTLQQLSVGRIKGTLENSKLKFVSQTSYDLTSYVKGATLTNDEVKFP
jgi:hypothetical protein